MNNHTNQPNQNAPVDRDYSLEAVPESARKGFWNMFFVMLGFTFFSASMSVGAKLGNGLDLGGFFWACLIGGVILSAYCGILPTSLGDGHDHGPAVPPHFGEKAPTSPPPFWALPRSAGSAWAWPCSPFPPPSSWGSTSGPSPSSPVSS